MILYHGSENIVQRPTFGLGKIHNDYGRGFYCTESRDMACEWAVGFDHDGYVNKYELDIADLRLLDLNSEEYVALHWLATLLQNRWFDVRSPLAREARAYLIETFPVSISDADVIVGYRADDSYFTFAQDFISGSISYRQLRNAMQLGELGLQFVVKSEKAFQRIRFLSAEQSLRSSWLPRREQRDRNARERYFDYERSNRKKGDLYIQQIIDEGMGPNDDRLR